MSRPEIVKRVQEVAVDVSVVVRVVVVVAVNVLAAVDVAVVVFRFKNIYLDPLA